MAAVPALGLALDQAPEPTFFVEQIEIEGAVVADPIVLSVSRLEAGRSYTEGELRDAVARIIRHPLVLDVDVALEKGSERGRYRLVLRLEEARRWFFGLDLESTGWAEEVSVDGLSTSRRVDEGVLFGGRRFAIGGRGELFTALSVDSPQVALGYRHHEVFGRPGLLTVDLSLARCEDVRRRVEESTSEIPGADADRGIRVERGCSTELLELLDPAAATWSTGETVLRAGLGFALPLAGDHSLGLRFESRHADSGIRRPAYEPSAATTFGFDGRQDDRLRLVWSYDSRDDPIAPRSGTSAEAGLELRRLSATLRPVTQPDAGTPVDHEMESVVVGLRGRATRFHPFGARQAVSLGADLFVGHRDAEGIPLHFDEAVSDGGTLWRTELSVGHSVLLQQRASPTGWRELHWSTDLTGFAGAEFLAATPRLDGFEEGFRISSGLSLRTGWGLFSLRLTYLDRGGD